MQKIDILKLLYIGLISEEDSYLIQSEILRKFHEGVLGGFPREALMLDKYEWSAEGSCDYINVAKWRYEGWPSHCARCSRRIIKEKFGWNGGTAKEKFKYRKKGQLVHISCEESYLKQIGYTDEDLK